MHVGKGGAVSELMGVTMLGFGEDETRLIVFRFDIGKYQSNPLSAGLVAGDACALFCRSVAVVMRLDLTKCATGNQAPQLGCWTIQ